MSEDKKVQYIGLDIGRGFAKIWTIGKDGNEVELSLKSEYCIGISDAEYENSTAITYNGVNLLVGLAAEKEGRPNRISQNEKYTQAVDKIIAAGISEVAWCKNIIIGLGIPNITFKNDEIEKTIDFYKGKEYKVYNAKKDKNVEFTIIDVFCEREADAVLCSGYCGLKEGISTGIVSIGFRTIEFSYYDEEFNFIESNSGSEEAGNITILKGIINALNKNSSHSYNEYEVDSNTKTEKIIELKKAYYEIASEGLMDLITSKWNNANEMNIIVTGGTIAHFSNVCEKLDVIKNPIFASAKGLYEIARERHLNEDK